MGSRKEGIGFKIRHYPLPRLSKCYGCLCDTCNTEKAGCRFKSRELKCINCLDNNNIPVHYCDNYITVFDNRFKVVYSKRKQQKYKNSNDYNSLLDKLDLIMSAVNKSENQSIFETSTNDLNLINALAVWVWVYLHICKCHIVLLEKRQ